MKDTIEYNNLAEEYAKNALNGFKNDNGELRINCDEKTALFLLKHGYMDGRISGEFDMLETKNNIQKYLLYLQTAGWSDLIDERWRDDVNKSLRNSFPEITDSEIQEVGKIIFI